MRTLSLRSPVCLILGVVAAVVLGGCSNSNPSTSHSSSTKRPSVAAPRAVPIVVGQVESEVVPGSTTTYVGADVLAASAKWTNAHGGIAGHPVRVITIDDHQDPGDGLAAAQTLISQDHVVSLVGTNEGTIMAPAPSAKWVSFFIASPLSMIQGRRHKVSECEASVTSTKAVRTPALNGYRDTSPLPPAPITWASIVTV